MRCFIPENRKPFLATEISHAHKIDICIRAPARNRACARFFRARATKIAAGRCKIDWRVKHGAADNTGYWWSLPVVAETWDGWLNDINGFHVKPEHVAHALDTAHGGPVEEGSVGGGTGMICYEFKGGNGTASRKIDMKDKAGAVRTFNVGVFLQANFGRRPSLTIAGVPVGKEIPGEVYKSAAADPSSGGEESGSCIAVVATDAPLLPNQLKRLARRVSLGLARTGTISGNGSGDLFVAFSTANPSAADPNQITHSVET